MENVAQKRDDAPRAEASSPLGDAAASTDAAALGETDAGQATPARKAFVDPPGDDRQEEVEPQLEPTTTTFRFDVRAFGTVKRGPLPGKLLAAASVRRGPTVRESVAPTAPPPIGLRFAIRGVDAANGPAVRGAVFQTLSAGMAESRRQLSVVLRTAEGEVVGTTGTLRRALAPIDTPEKAQLLLEIGYGLDLGFKGNEVPCAMCEERYVRRTKGGFELVVPIGHPVPGPCPHSDPGIAYELALVAVTTDGKVAIKAIDSSFLTSPLLGSKGPPVAPCVGRDTEGSGRTTVRKGASREGYFAALANDEAVSVRSFERLANELELASAPQELVLRARRAAKDEARHARVMGALAQRGRPSKGNEPEQALPLRPLRDVLLENAREGCVRETFAAVVATHQATHAELGLRPIFRRIAKDERAHAKLAWDVYAWGKTALTPNGAGELDHALRTAFDDLEHDLADPVAAPPGAGEPTAVAKARLVRELQRALAA